MITAPSLLSRLRQFAGRPRNDQNAAPVLMESLDSRQMMAQTSPVVYQGFEWSLQLTGAGSFTFSTDANFGVPLITLSGTDLTSNFSVSLSPLVRRGPMFSNLNIEKIVGGTLNSITLEQNSVDLRTQESFLPLLGTSPAETGILLSGYAKTITVGNMTGTDIHMSSTSSANRSTINAGSIVGTRLALARGVFSDDDSNITSAGVIDSFSASNYVFGTLDAQRIGSIRIDNARFANRGVFLRPEFDITTHSTTATYGVKTIDITGDVFAGTWTIAAPVQRITVGNVFTNDFTAARGGPSAGDLFITVTGRLGQYRSFGDIFGSVTATTIGSIQADGTIGAQITTTDALSNTANSIDSIRAERLDFMTLGVNNGIGLLNVGQLQQAIINAGWINTINVTGAPGVNEVINNSTINLNNISRTSNMTKMNVQGAISLSAFKSRSSIGDVTMRGLLNSTFLVGNALTTTFPANVGAFSDNKRINSFTLSAPFVGPNFAASLVAAAQFGKLTITSASVTVDNVANAHAKIGFAADSITTLAYTGTGGSLNQSNITAATTLLNATDFFVQVF